MDVIDTENMGVCYSFEQNGCGEAFCFSIAVEYLSYNWKYLCSNGKYRLVLQKKVITSNAVRIFIVINSD